MSNTSAFEDDNHCNTVQLLLCFDPQMRLFLQAEKAEASHVPFILS